MEQPQIMNQKGTQKAPEQGVVEAIRTGSFLSEHYEYLRQKAFQNGILPFILHNGGRAEEAEEIFHDALLTLYRLVGENKYKSQYSVCSLLFGIGRRKYISLYQKNKNAILRNENYHQEHFQDLVSDEKMIQYIDDILQGNTERERDLEMLEKALKQLDEPDRSILTYFYLEKKSFKEIFSLLPSHFGFKDSEAVKKRKYYSLEKLRKLMGS